jgi:tetratricopeptide (TPR) repeat protein
MARAAAKRRPPARHPEADRRRHKDSGGQRFEDTLFFNRIRKQAKWMFVFLAIVFAGGFVLFGVGSNLGGLSDIFSGIGGSGSSGPSVKKELERTQENPKNATAWHDLATAYDTKGELDAAIAAWTTYTTLRPKDVDGLTQLATDYEQKFSRQTEQARAAAYDAQTAQPSTYGPPTTSPLGRALGSVSDPIAQAISGSANQRYNDALSTRQETAQKLVAAYQRIATLQPAEPSAQLQLAQAAQSAGDPTTAVAAYKKFLQLAPDDPNAVYAKQQIKALQAQLAPSAQG